MKAILSGGNNWRHKYQGKLKSLYGFETWHAMFDLNEWEFEYMPTTDIYEDTSRLVGVDLWIVSLNWDTMYTPRFSEVTKIAKNQGTFILGEPNAGWKVNLPPYVPDAVVADWSKNVNAIATCLCSDDVVKLYECVYGIPCFGCPMPVDMEVVGWELELSMGEHPILPFDDKDFYVFGHDVTTKNMDTLLAAERLGINLLVNAYAPGRVSRVDDVVSCCEDHVRCIGILPHYAWLNQIFRSSGIFYCTETPSCGRPIMYAGSMGVPSIGTRSSWQDILFPECITKASITKKEWNVLVETAGLMLNNLPERMSQFSPEMCHDRMTNFLKSVGVL